MTPIIPIGNVDPVQALEASGRAAAWVASVFKSRRSKQERGAALVLRELGVLAISAHAMNNAARAVSAVLLRYETVLGGADQRQLFDAIDAFLNDALLVPELDRSLAALRRLRIMIHDGSLQLDVHVADALGDMSDVLAIAAVPLRWGVCSALTDRANSSDRRLAQLWDVLRRDPTSLGASAADKMRDLALELRSPAPSAWLSRVDVRLGGVRAAIGIRHPRLPPPDWLYRSLPSSAVDAG